MLANLKGALTFVLLTVNVIVWFVPILMVGLVKLLIPLPAWRRWTSRWLTWFGERWVGCNQRILALTQSIEWHVTADAALDPHEWYLVIANHRSWIDILVLQGALHERIPFLKFFIKRVLVWVPFLGLAWWAMDMPFVRRHTRAQIERRPELRERDLETTRRACARFRAIPTSVIVFVEGTRHTARKAGERASPYRHLLPPRAGGMAFVLAAMGDILHRLLDVTLVYEPAAPSLWDLCCGRVRRIVVDVREHPIEHWLTGGDYTRDAAFRERFQAWLGTVWVDKDMRIEALQRTARSEPPP
jgi:1-acyl-sn-glycerol-3-phosphate acyltransferase